MLDVTRSEVFRKMPNPNPGHTTRKKISHPRHRPTLPAQVGRIPPSLGLRTKVSGDDNILAVVAVAAVTIALAIAIAITTANVTQAT